MRVLNPFPPTYYVMFLEYQEEPGASPWVSIPVGSTHWSVAIATEHDLQEGESVDIEVSNNEKAPDAKYPGPVVLTLSAGSEASYIRASYKWARAVKKINKKKSPITVYGCFSQPTGA